MSGRRSDRKTYGEPVKYTPGGKTVTHGGSGNAYANYGCRCEPCTEANTARNERRRAERYETTRTDGLPENIPHGASAYANWGCRCDVCSLEHSQKTKNARESQ